MQLILMLGNREDTLEHATPLAAVAVGGLSVAQRALRAAQLSGIDSVAVVGEDTRLMEALLADPIVAKIGTRQAIVAEGAIARAGETLRGLGESLEESFIVVPGDRVLSPALLKGLLKTPGSLALFDPERHLIAAKLERAHALEEEAIGEGSLEELVAMTRCATRISTRDELVRVRDQQSAAQAHEALFRTLRKPLSRNGDGLTAYVINRPISLSISRLLVHTPLTPNQVTFINLLIGVYAGYLLASGDVVGIALGALLMQLVSIFDGIDGELSRMKLLMSLRGAWFDSVSDDVIRVATIVGLGISSYKLSPEPTYLWATAAGCFGILSTVFTAYRDMMQQGTGTMNSVQWWFEAEGRKPNLWQSFLVILSFILKRDTYTLLLMTIAAVGWPQVALFVMVVGICIITCTHFIQKLIRLVRGDRSQPLPDVQELTSKEMSRA